MSPAHGAQTTSKGSARPWQTQPAEEHLRQPWWLPLCTTRLPVLCQVRGWRTKPPEAVEWAEDRPLLLAREAPGAPRRGAQSPMVGAGCPFPPRTQQVPSAGQGELKGQRRSWTLAALSHKLPRGSQDPSCPKHSPIPGQGRVRGSKQPGAGSGQGAAPSLPAAGYFCLFFLSPTCLFPSSFPSGQFPLLAAPCQGGVRAAAPGPTP